MHMSRFFLFHMISLSVFSCSAMENKQLTQTQDFSKKIIHSLPIFGRLDKGESGADIFFDIARGTVNGVNTVCQGYNNIRNSPTTQAITTNVQTGAEMLATNAYSAGVTLCTATHNLFQWAYNQRYAQDQNSITFDKALITYNQQMQSSMLTTSNKDECQQNILNSLTTIKTDISLITQFINKTKGITENNSSGIRTTIIDYVIADVTSDKNISEEKAQDYINIINEIAKFSKAEDGENSLEESFVELPIFVNDGEQLASELEKADNPDNNAFSAFIQKYMSDNSTMQAVLESKKNQNQKEIEKYRSIISTLTNEIQGHKETIERLKTENKKIETEKCSINTAMIQQAEEKEKLEKLLQEEQSVKTQVTQEKAVLESKIQQLWSFIRISSGVITISAIALLVHYFKLYEQCMALLH